MNLFGVVKTKMEQRVLYNSLVILHGLPLPGRMPGVNSDSKSLLLPTYMTKRYVYRKYRALSPSFSICRRKLESGNASHCSYETKNWPL